MLRQRALNSIHTEKLCDAFNGRMVVLYPSKKWLLIWKGALVSTEYTLQGIPIGVRFFWRTSFFLGFCEWLNCRGGFCSRIWSPNSRNSVDTPFPDAVSLYNPWKKEVHNKSQKKVFRMNPWDFTDFLLNHWSHAMVLNLFTSWGCNCRHWNLVVGCTTCSDTTHALAPCEEGGAGTLSGMLHLGSLRSNPCFLRTCWNVCVLQKAKEIIFFPSLEMYPNLFCV